MSATATPSTVTLTATYSQFSTENVDVDQPFEIITPPPTTTTDPTTTTTASVGGGGATPGQTGSANELPRTGSSTPALVWIGIVALGSGAGLLLTRSHWRTRPRIEP